MIGRMERTDHDRLFKELLSTFFVEFVALFLPEVRAYLESDSLVSLDKELLRPPQAPRARPLRAPLPG